MKMLKFCTKVFLFLAIVAAVSSKAQVVEDAREGPFSLYAGGFGSYFNAAYPANQKMEGYGVYTDIKFRRWVQLEGEVRWLQLNEFEGAYQRNYGGGPKFTIHHYGKLAPYAKFLVNDTLVNYASGYGYGHFLDFTPGGGIEYKLNRKVNIRVADFEYHYLTNYFGTHLSPYGVSVGLAYRVY